MSPVRPAVPDPEEVMVFMWDQFGGGWYGEPRGYGWDVGANCGQSILVMRRLFERVTSFEPHPGCVEYVAAAFPGTDIRQIALSDRDGTVELALPPGEQTETGQLVTIGISDMEWSPKSWRDIPRWTVPCRTADSLADELGLPDFIKVDTEGHEVRVMQGAQGILHAGYTDWLIETHSEANNLWCQGELKDAGYQYEILRHPHYREGSRLWKAHSWLRAFAPRERP